MACVNRVARYTLSGNTLSSPTIILDNIPSQAGNHNGGDLHFGKDGFLYVGVGDSGCDPRGDSGCQDANNAAQDLSLLNGQDPAGHVERRPGAGQPVPGAATAWPARPGSAAPAQVCREIFAYGVRNPFRLAFDPNAAGARASSSTTSAADAWEEIDDAVASRGQLRLDRAVRARARVGHDELRPAPGAVKNPFLAYTPLDGLRVDHRRRLRAQRRVARLRRRLPLRRLRLRPASSRCRRRAAGVDVDASWPATPAPVVELQFVGDELWYTTYAAQVRRIVPPPRPVGGSASRLVPIPPARKLDTRVGIGGPAGVVPAGGTRTVTPRPEVPAGAVAAVVNVTITRPTAPGFVTAWPAGQAPTAHVHAQRHHGRARRWPTRRWSPSRPAQQLNLFTETGGHLIVDVYGYFAAGRDRPRAGSRRCAPEPAPRHPQRHGRAPGQGERAARPPGRRAQRRAARPASARWPSWSPAPSPSARLRHRVADRRGRCRPRPRSTCNGPATPGPTWSWCRSAPGAR